MPKVNVNNVYFFTKMNPQQQRTQEANIHILARARHLTRDLLYRSGECYLFTTDSTEHIKCSHAFQLFQRHVNKNTESAGHTFLKNSLSLCNIVSHTDNNILQFLILTGIRLL